MTRISTTRVRLRLCIVSSSQWQNFPIILKWIMDECLEIVPSAAECKSGGKWRQNEAGYSYFNIDMSGGFEEALTQK